MINGIEGIPGSGKSYEAVAFHVLEALKKGRLVVTNLPLVVELFAAIDPGYRDLIELRWRAAPIRGTWDPNRIDPHSGQGHAFELAEDGSVQDPAESVPVFGHVWCYWHEWRHPKTKQGPLFVIDECHVALPKSETDQQVIQWYKLHRHFNVDVLLMTQNFRDIDGAVAGLLAMMIRCRKADFLGKKDEYIRKVHAGFRGALVSQESRKYNPAYFGLYKSHTQGSSVAEASASDVSPFIVKWRRATVAFWIVGAALCTWMFWPSDKPVKAAKHRAPQVAAAPAPVRVASAPVHPASSPAAASAPQVAQADAEVEPFPSMGVHMRGRLQMGDRTVYIFVVSQNGQVQQTFTDSELAQAGYKFKPTGSCTGVIEFGGELRPVSCDAPGVQIYSAPKGTVDKPRSTASAPLA